MEECLTCPICFERFSTQERLPVLFACGHSYCLVCVRKMQLPLVCPTDRKPEPRPIAALPKNFVVTRMLEYSQEPSQFEKCGAHSFKKCKFFCIQCRVGFCSACIIRHQFHNWVDVHSTEPNAEANQYIHHLINLIASQFQKASCAVVETQRVHALLEERHYSLGNQVKDKFNRLRASLNAKEKDLLVRLDEHVFAARQEAKNLFVQASSDCCFMESANHQAERLYADVLRLVGSEKVAKIMQLNSLAETVSRTPEIQRSSQIVGLPEAIYLDTRSAEKAIHKLALGERLLPAADLGLPTKKAARKVP